MAEELDANVGPHPLTRSPPHDCEPPADSDADVGARAATEPAVTAAVPGVPWPARAVEGARGVRERIVACDEVLRKLAARLERLIVDDSARLVAAERAAMEGPVVVRLSRERMVNGVPQPAGEPLAVVHLQPGLSLADLVGLIRGGKAE